MNAAARPALDLRWMISRDLSEVLAIERESFDRCWTRADFLALLRKRNCVGTVAANPLGHVAGFVLYELREDSLALLNLAVAPWARREGVGTALVAKLIAKLWTHRRTFLSALVRAGNLPAQLFFRARGFEAADVWRGHYADPADDAYLFEFHLPTPEETEEYR